MFMSLWELTCVSLAVVDHVDVSSSKIVFVASSNSILMISAVIFKCIGIGCQHSVSMQAKLIMELMLVLMATCNCYMQCLKVVHVYRYLLQKTSNIVDVTRLFK